MNLRSNCITIINREYVETPSPISITTPVSFPDAYKLSRDCGAIKIAGTLNLSKKISAIFSVCLFGENTDCAIKTYNNIFNL